MSLQINTSDQSPNAPQGLIRRVASSALGVLRALPFSGVSPIALAVLATLLIVGTAGGVVLAQRLAEIRYEQSQSQAGVQSGPVVRLPGGLTAEDFTLAPEAVRELDADSARAFNQGIPFSTLPILGAKPFIMTPDDIVQYSRALDCLTAAIYYEAASETPQGQAAVAQVVLNRMRHPAYPRTVCGVVFQGSERTTGCQFSFTCDGAMNRPPSAIGWARAKAVASAALNGSVAIDVGMATHYHTDWVAPYWAERLVKMRQIGTHIFYRWSGTWGLPRAFSGQHAGEEPVIAKMAALATPLEIIEPVTELVVTEVPPVAAPPLIVTTRIAEAEPKAAEAVEVAPPPPAPVARPAAAPVLANPLATPTDQRPPRRSRIPVPSGW